jgi:hypothetical protein
MDDIHCSRGAAMPRDYYPRRESDIRSFTAHFSEKISAAPADYGLTQARADEYAVLQQTFSDAYLTVQDRGANSTSAVVAKENARVALEAGTRALVKTVKAQWSVTNEMRINLGLPPRGARRRHVAVPEEAPILRVVGAAGGAVQVRLVDAGSTRRGLPRDARGAILFGFVGQVPPSGRDRWTFKGGTSRATAEVRFDAGLPPGTKVWLTACWINARAERGPSCAPVCTYLQYGMTFQPLAQRRAA